MPAEKLLQKGENHMSETVKLTPIKPKAKLRGGLRLKHLKKTAEMQSIVMPPPETVVIPMSQHIGSPAVPTVKKGDRVFVGTVIGDSDRFISAPVHSSVSGTVTQIGTIVLPNGVRSETVVIESDGQMTPDENLSPPEVKTEADLTLAARNCGLVGLGGAGFPTYVKLTRKEGTELDTLIINAAECEPYITSDYRTCIENTDEVIDGVLLLKKIMNFKQVIIAVEKNKPKAIEKLLLAVHSRNEDESVKVMRLSSAYPQGAEKVLIYNACKRILPVGKLPADVGCVVMNVTSVAVLSNYIKTGMPLVSKRITIDGNIAAEPKNVIVPIGTKIKDAVSFAGGMTAEPSKILYGGVMMGNCVADDEMPIIKQNNAILLFGRETTAPAVRPCIKCGRCAAVCPMSLTPARVDLALKKGDIDTLRTLSVGNCMECGSCSYVCPSKRPLTQNMKIAKAKTR